MAEYVVRRTRCKGCRRCLRVCPTKAVWFTGGRSQIYEESCVSCGLCAGACRNGAIGVREPWEALEAVLAAREVGGRAVAVLECSFAGYFSRYDPAGVVGALASIGFVSVWDTSVASHALASWFSRLAVSGEAKDGAQALVVTECPVVGAMVDLRFKSLVHSLVQPASAAELTARILGKRYPDAVVAVFSPCAARRAELRTSQPPRCVDAAFTFRELEEFLAKRGVNPALVGKAQMDGEVSAYGRLAAGRGGHARIMRAPRFGSACGADELGAALDALSQGCRDTGVLVAQACSSCARPHGLGREGASYGSDASVETFSESAVGWDGPVSPAEETMRELEELIVLTAREREKAREGASVAAAGAARERPLDVERVLRQMGKTSQADEADCGACGYDTCRELARAVAEGRDDAWHCPVSGREDRPVLRSRGASVAAGKRGAPERLALGAPVELDSGSVRVVAYSVEMGKVLQLASKVACVGSTVLITGESGVGKEVVARLVHSMSERKGGPFIKINCGAIPETLLESELFGYETGAFTGARREGKPGLMELANGGTLFLDEIPELPLPLQVKLLQVIQEKRLVRIGGVKPVDVDARIVAATNRDVKAMVKQGLFRSDLYYRLNVVPIVVPPLRERKDDIIPLTYYFLEKFGSKYGVRKQVDDDAKKLLCDYSWPGNVRELENTIERLVVTVDEPVITGRCLREMMPPPEAPPAQGTSARAMALEAAAGPAESRSPSVTVVGVVPLRQAVREVERQILANAARSQASTHKMAHLLGVNQSTVVRKLKRLQSHKV